MFWFAYLSGVLVHMLEKLYAKLWDINISINKTHFRYLSIEFANLKQIFDYIYLPRRGRGTVVSTIRKMLCFWQYKEDKLTVSPFETCSLDA